MYVVNPRDKISERSECSTFLSLKFKVSDIELPILISTSVAPNNLDFVIHF